MNWTILHRPIQEGFEMAAFSQYFSFGFSLLAEKDSEL